MIYTNPLFIEWERYSTGAWTSTWAARTRLVQKYSWAVPNDEALQTIAKYEPIVEIGAGTGYWASILKDQLNVTIQAFDQSPPALGLVKNKYHVNTSQFTEVRVGGPEVVRQHYGYALMLSWPPYNQDFASECLKLFEGDTLIFIGEVNGCCGTDNFFEQLSNWKISERVQIPQWPGIHDELIIYRR